MRAQWESTGRGVGERVRGGPRGRQNGLEGPAGTRTWYDQCQEKKAGNRKKILNSGNEAKDVTANKGLSLKKSAKINAK